MSLSSSEVENSHKAATVDGVLPAIVERWSPRSFSGREVSTADLVRVFEAARWAPSSSNEQPWRFVVGLKGSQTHARLAGTLAGFNQAWAPNAPVLILGLARTTFSRNGNPNTYALYDLGAATAYLALQATALGLHTHQMGGYSHDAVRSALGIPDDYALGAMIALGFRGEPGALANDALQTRELAPRERKPLREMVFAAWDEPANLG